MANPTKVSASKAPEIDLESLTFMDELPKIWGRPWGAQSEMGRLRMVMVSRPSDSEASPDVRDNPHFFASQGGFPNLSLMRKQHSEMVKVLEQFGSEVVYFDPPP